MSEKLSEVYEKYDMEIIATKKGRGATILTTTDGLRILEPFRGSVTRLEQEYVLKQLFEKAGCTNLDSLIPNREGSLLTCDKYRQPFVLKKYFEGNECDMHTHSEVLRAVRALAQFHIYGQEIALQFPKAWKETLKEQERKRVEEIRAAIANGEELEKISYVYEISQTALEEALRTQGETGEIPEHLEKEIIQEEIEPEPGTDGDIRDTFLRHNKELKKIQRFVLKVKKKNSFETLFLQVFWNYYNQGVQCVEMLSKVLRTEDKFHGICAANLFQNHYGICHGSFNQHNVILSDTEAAIVHFERFSRGNQLNDLYQFARKVMEKNHFEYELLVDILKTYSESIELSKEDYQYMYILFSYPEKFWKIANSYYNTSKAFLSPKYVEKLETVILQETEKQKLLKQFSLFI